MKGILRPTKEKYLVNEEKGVVIYFISFKPRNLPIRYFDFYPIWNLIKDIGYDKDGNHIIVNGISKCCPDDTFNLKKGIQIARNRAEIKLAQIEQMVIRKMCKEIGTFWDYTSALYNNRSEMIKEKKNFIKNI